MPPLLVEKSPRIAIRAVHLDLKGTPPTFERLLSLLDVFAAGGYNAILIEWEDMFPWRRDPRFRCETAYTTEQVRQFYAAATQKGFEIIPLVQCIGHMETFLKWPEYASFREVPLSGDVLNVLAEGGRAFVQSLVDEVLALLPGIRHFHLGGDEAWTFGTHPLTRAYAEKYGKDKLYLQHVEPILDQLTAKAIRPILWHDMMVEWSDEQLQRLSAKCDLMVWGYTGHPDQTDYHFNSRYIQKFRDAGVTLWAAGAFKGAEGPMADYPLVEQRLLNANAWMSVHERFKFKGICATGWSRYNTPGFQCESMESALDSLLLLGKSFYDGHADIADRPAALEELRNLGQRQRFEDILETMKQLSYGLQHTLKNAISLHQLKTQAITDPRRHGSGIELKWLGWVRKDLRIAEKAAEEMKKLYNRLIEPIWVDRYLQTRMQVIREEAARAETIVQTMNPQGYITVPPEGKP